MIDTYLIHLTSKYVTYFILGVGIWLAESENAYIWLDLFYGYLI